LAAGAGALTTFCAGAGVFFAVAMMEVFSLFRVARCPLEFTRGAPDFRGDAGKRL
jgi:hypothetical protein